MPRVILHVGSPKTGTTFLQNILWSQREVAAAQGVHLPLATFHDHFLGSLDVRGLGGRPPHPKDSEGAWNRLVNATRTHDGTVLISHELLAAADPEQARKAVGWFGADLRVDVVITARDLLRQMTAEWQEHVKHKHTMTLQEFVQLQRKNAGERRGWFWLMQDCAGIARRWGSTLPASQVHVVTVPDRAVGEPGGSLLWTRFAGLLGLDADSFDVTKGRSNDSLGREQTELLRRVNAALGERLPFPGPYPGVAKEVLAHRILAGQEGARLSLTDDDAAFACQEARRIAEELDALGCDVVGSLEELVPSEEAVQQRTDPDAYGAVSDAALVEHGIAALADLLVVLSERTVALREAEHAVERSRTDPVRTALSQLSDDRPGLRKARDVYRSLRKN